MCLIGRHLEANGIPTVVVSAALDITEAGRPPRAVFVDYPLGHTAGRPHDPADQLAVARAALARLDAATEPGIVVRLPNRWPGDGSWKQAVTDPAMGDVRSPRDTTPRYQYEEDRRLAEGG